MRKLTHAAARRLTDWLVLLGWAVMIAGALSPVPWAYPVMFFGLAVVWSWVPIYAFFRERS